MNEKNTIGGDVHTVAENEQKEDIKVYGEDFELSAILVRSFNIGEPHYLRTFAANLNTTRRLDTSSVYQDVPVHPTIRTYSARDLHWLSKREQDG